MLRISRLHDLDGPSARRDRVSCCRCKLAASAVGFFGAAKPPLRRLDRQDLRKPGAAWRAYLDSVACRVADQCAAERGFRGSRSRAAHARDFDLHAAAVLVLDLHERTDADLAGSARRLVYEHGVVETRTQRPDARLEQALLVLGRVVLEVLRQVTMLSRRLDRLDDRLTPRAFKLCKLGREGGTLRLGQLVGLRLGHRRTIGAAAPGARGCQPAGRSGASELV